MAECYSAPVKKCQKKFGRCSGKRTILLGGQMFGRVVHIFTSSCSSSKLPERKKIAPTRFRPGFEQVMLRRPTAALEKQQRSRPNIWDPDGVSQSLLQRFDQTGDAEKGACVGEVVNGKVAFFKTVRMLIRLANVRSGKIMIWKLTASIIATLESTSTTTTTTSTSTSTTTSTSSAGAKFSSLNSCSKWSVAWEEIN